MKLSRKGVFYSVASLIVTLVILTWLHRLDEQERYATARDSTPAPLRVSAQAARTGTIIQWVQAEGRAEAVRKSFLQFEESGRVAVIGTGPDERPLREGMSVTGPDGNSTIPGQLLARIDSRDKRSEVTQSEAAYNAAQREIDMLRATLRQTEDDLAEARQDHNRKKQLFEQKFLARSEYDQARFRYTKAVSAVSIAKLNIASAQARLNSARAELNKANRSPLKLELRAPFDGIIGRINIREGDYFDPANVAHTDAATLSATAPITIIDPTEMEITLHLPEADGRKIRPGQRAVVAPSRESWARGTTLDTAPTVNGKVYSVSPQLDGKRRAIRVKVRLHQLDNAIPDGMYTACWIAAEEKNDALCIPLASLLYDGSQPYVFVYDNGTARRRNLSLGLRNRHRAEILSGLTLGEQVICKGRKKLVDGAPIALVDPTQGRVQAHVE